MHTQNCLATALLMLLLAPCPSLAQVFFSGEKLSATVTESGSGKPIEGAVVVVYWQLEQGKLHGHDYQVLHKAETVTDGQGNFYIEAWGPKYGGLFWSMGGASPYAYVLKGGYKFEVVSNYSVAVGGFRCPGSKLAEVSRGIPTHTRSTIVASWNGCQIPLTQPTESPDNYAIRLASIKRELCDDGTAVQCDEPLQRYFDEERRRLLKVGAKHDYFQW